jgi:hypothetical protein
MDTEIEAQDLENQRTMTLQHSTSIAVHETAWRRQHMRRDYPAKPEDMRFFDARKSLFLRC